MRQLYDMIDGLSRPVREKFCSTFGIVNAAVGAAIAGDTWEGIPAYRAQFADVALDCNATFVGCTTAFTTGFGIRAVRAYVWLKNYKLGVSSGTNPFLGAFFQLQVATGTGAFNATNTSTGTSVIATMQAARATSAFYFNGVVPDNQAYAACRLVVFPSPANWALTDTASFDCNIDATP